MRLQGLKGWQKENSGYQISAKHWVLVSGDFVPIRVSRALGYLQGVGAVRVGSLCSRVVAQEDLQVHTEHLVSTLSNQDDDVGMLDAVWTVCAWKLSYILVSLIYSQLWMRGRPSVQPYKGRHPAALVRLLLQA